MVDKSKIRKADGKDKLLADFLKPSPELTHKLLLKILKTKSSHVAGV